MSDSPGLKSAYELAMERLRKRDEEAGIERRPVTDAQKAEIAEIRSLYGSRLAELEVLHDGRMRASVDPAERAKLDQEYQLDRERLTSDRDSRVEKVRQG